jgi:hypothetical protein
MGLTSGNYYFVQFIGFNGQNATKKLEYSCSPSVNLAMPRHATAMPFR